MRNNHHLFASFALLLSVLTSNDTQGLPGIKVCWEISLKPPYLMKNSQNQPTGIAVDMLNRILENQPKKIENTFRPWKRCLADAKAGRVDIVPNASYKEKRKEFSLYTDPLYKTHLVLFYRLQKYPQRLRIDSQEDLLPYTLGGVLGFNYSFYSDQIMLDRGAKNRRSLIEMLRAGRFDFAVAQQEVISMMAKNNEVNLAGLGNIADPVKPEKAYHILVSKKSRDAKELQKILNKGIQSLHDSGQTALIMHKYLGSP